MIITDGKMYVIASRVGSWWEAERGGTRAQLVGDQDFTPFDIPVKKFTQLMLYEKNAKDDDIVLIKDNDFVFLDTKNKINEFLGEQASDTPKRTLKRTPIQRHGSAPKQSSTQKVSLKTCFSLSKRIHIQQ